MIIEVDGLIKSFGGQKVLDDISFKVKRGEILVILGESGTGKSVLLKHLVGLIKPDKGSIIIDGEEITGLKEKRLLQLRKKMGYMFQEGALYDFMNVYHNIAFPLKEHSRLTSEEIGEKIRKLLKLIDLEGIETKYPAELSGGMKKRVALARSLVFDSKILFCDEPTSGLDPIRSRDISDLIREVTHQQHCTTIVTSHDISNAFRIADRALLLKNGKIELMGSKQDFIDSDNTFVRTFID